MLFETFVTPIDPEICRPIVLTIIMFTYESENERGLQFQLYWQNKITQTTLLNSYSIL